MHGIHNWTFDRNLYDKKRRGEMHYNMGKRDRVRIVMSSFFIFASKSFECMEFFQLCYILIESFLLS